MIKFTDMTVQGRPYSGWILYTEEESLRNRHYIDLYRKACDKYGLSIRLGIYQPPDQWDGACRERVAAYTGAVRGHSFKDAGTMISGSGQADFVINRTRDYCLALELERLGIRVYNHSGIAQLGNDKAGACRFMARHGIPMMPTVYGVRMPPWYPAVVKACGGHGGTEVWMIRDEREWEEWKRNTCQPQKDYMVQKAASDLGRDVRVYVVGNRIAACVCRSCDRDFRSNFCLGGNVELYELKEKERALVQRVLGLLDIGMAGIDFIFHHGEMVFNEIEDMAGARSLYLLSDYDIVDEYIKFIQEDMGACAAKEQYV